MAVNQDKQRKRRSGPKVKTGCGTCKIRRVKCDETKPSCKRCSTTGRKCDGYNIDITIAGLTPNSSTELIQRISVHTPGSTEEKRGFDFFLRNTAAELSGYFDSSFWGKLILAASASKPYLRHAVIALGALHEDFSRKRLVPSSLLAQDQRTEFALSQYAKAVGALRRSLASEKEEPLTALMSCILFAVFDSLGGWFQSAMVHLQSGFRILRDMRKLSTKSHLVEENMVPFLLRLSVQSAVYVETKHTGAKKAFSGQLMEAMGDKVITSQEFGSLEEARNTLYYPATGLFCTMWDGDLLPLSHPRENFAKSEKYISQLALWNIAFEKFMTSKSKDLTSRELQGAAILKIHQTTSKIIAGIRPDMTGNNPMVKPVTSEKLCEYSNDFGIIVNLARPLVAAAEQDSKNGKQPLTFSSDVSLVGPLYYVCINCPSASIRASAIDLLRRCPRREGMWNSVVIAQMVQEYWDLEAKHKEGQEMGLEVGESRFPVPFSDRGSVHFAYFNRPEEME